MKEKKKTDTIRERGKEDDWPTLLGAKKCSVAATRKSHQRQTKTKAKRRGGKKKWKGKKKHWMMLA